MEHIEDAIADMMNSGEHEEKAKKWDEQLAEVIEEIRELKVAQNGLDMEMQEHTMFDGKLRVYMPSDFKKMGNDDISQKYSSEPRPDLVYYNKQDTVNIGFTIIEENISNEDVAGVRDIMKNAVLSASPAAEILDEGDFAQDENVVAYYACLNFVLGGQLYSLIYIAPMAGKLLLCTLSCFMKDMETYKLLFYGMMKTAKAEK